MRKAFTDKILFECPQHEREIVIIKRLVMENDKLACKTFEEWERTRKRKMEIQSPSEERTEKKSRQEGKKTQAKWTLVYCLTLRNTKPGYVARRLKVLLPASITWKPDKEKNEDEEEQGANSCHYIFNVEILSIPNDADPVNRLKKMIEFFFNPHTRDHYNFSEVIGIEFREAYDSDTMTPYIEKLVGSSAENRAPRPVDLPPFERKSAVVLGGPRTRREDWNEFMESGLDLTMEPIQLLQ